jgi:hypothetical protein
VVKVKCFENHPPGAKEAAEKLRRAGESPEKHPSGAKARVDFTATYGTRPRGYPGRALSKQCLNIRFSAACKARRLLSTIFGTAEAVPFQNTTLTIGC